MQPERPIEKSLRELADERRKRQGEVFTLPSWTRRLLQSEVERRFQRGSAGEQVKAPWLGGFWRRFAWGFALVTILAVVGIFSHIRSRREIYLASNTLSRTPQSDELAVAK